jgi:hypothetical protein
MTMERVDEFGGDGVLIDVTLSFDPADPFAVTAMLHSGSGTVQWTFGRDLLVDGMHQPAGDGDVLVRPGLDYAGHSAVIIELRAPQGSFMGQLATRELGPFVRDMLDVVPPGAESGLVDVEALVEQLLRPDSYDERK